MSVAYLLRLVCLCLAAFFLVHLAVGLLVSAISPAVVRRAGSMTARSAARFLLALRLTPVALALFVVVALCVPSYLWLEPEAAGEEVGILCLAAAILGVAVWAFSITRTIRTALRSARYVAGCQLNGIRTRMPGCRLPVWIVDGSVRSLMLAGILRPRIYVSRRVMSALSGDQLTAAVCHESAHQVSRDNLKRLLMLLTPGLLPFFRSFESLETHWARFAEWAADDRAVGGDSERSLSLAAALVSVARLAPSSTPPPVLASLFESSDLAERVDRLLRGPSIQPAPRAIPPAALVLAAVVVLPMLQPATFHSVHRLLESLIH